MNTNTLPRKFPRKLLLGGAGAVALIALAAGGGYAVTAGDDDQPIPAGDRERAEEAALAETGGGTVTDTEMDDEQSRYEVEVTRDDGTEVDVQLDDGFDVVSTETDGPDDDADGDDTGDDDDPDDRALSTAERDRAERAALAETGGGTVTSTEADGRDGYEVEVTRDDGTEVDVRLDRDFDVVSAHTDGPDDNDDEDGDND